MLLPRELPMHRRECLVGHLERPANVFLGMRDREKPVVVRVEVDSASATLGSEEAAPCELSSVGGKGEKRDRRRTALADFEPVRARLVAEAVPEHPTEAVHALDCTT